MPVPSAIQLESTALARIVGGLFALLGLTGGPSSGLAPQRIARSLHRAVSLVLRPAESAARRLIYLLSLSIPVKSATVRPMPAGIISTGDARQHIAFRLFDPRLRLVRKTKSKAKNPRATPRISIFGISEVRTIAPGHQAKVTQKDSEIESAALLRRLAALKSALDDLPRQARRLRRALQRRSKVPRLKMQGPMRPGYPPGFSINRHRQRRRHEIDYILQRCHERAREALPPDTS